MDPLRDRVFGLLCDLCGSPREASPDTLRLLSHTLLGVARDHAPAQLFAVRDALPWVAALVELEQGTEPASVATMLVSRGAVQAFDETGLAARLRAACAPSGAPGRVLAELAALDARLIGLCQLEDAPLGDALIADPVLWGAAMSVGVGTSEVARRFGAALGGDCAMPRAMQVWCTLESASDAQMSACGDDSSFGARTWCFERSASVHLREAGLGPVMRATLYYGGPDATEEQLRRDLRRFRVLAGDRAMEELALALVAVRGEVDGTVRGRRGLPALDRWAHYLRGPSRGLARTLGTSVREAANYAHFCLHVMNFCDLAGQTAVTGGEAARRAMMEVEDELRARAQHASLVGESRDDEEAGAGAEAAL